MLNNGLVVCERCVDVRSGHRTLVGDLRQRDGERPSGRSQIVKYDKQSAFKQPQGCVFIVT
jgi:hypothetical protein